MTECPTYTAQIYIGGDYAHAKQVCRAYCMEKGACVTVEPVFYAYTGAGEDGVRVGFINYARFPSDPAAIFAQAVALADLLRAELAQHSYSIIATDRTVFHTVRAA